MTAGRLAQRGLSLIEILVGLVIGLVAIMVIGQVVAVFEGQKRTSTGGSDAQTNGAVALMMLADEIRMAGFGLTSPGLKSGNGNLYCPLGTNIYYNGSVISDPGGVPEDGMVAAVRIVDGGSGPDQIIVARSDAEYGVLVATVQTAVSLPTVKIDSDIGYSTAGQLFLIGAADGSKICTLMQISKAATANGNDWDLDVSSSATTPFDPANPSATYKTFPNYAAGDKVVNMGMWSGSGNSLMVNRGFMYRRYLVADERMAVADQSIAALSTTYTSANSTPMVDYVVSIKAQYGIAPAGSQTVTQWVAATSGSTWDASTLKPADIARIKAIRIAVVTRSAQYERETVSPASLTLWTKINGGDDAPPTYTVPDRNYRYKVFTTVVPLKNVVWGKLS